MFARNQSGNMLRLAFRELYNCFISDDVSYMVASSANMMHLVLFVFLREWGRSLVYMMHSNGPRTLPWSTPVVISCILDVDHLY